MATAATDWRRVIPKNSALIPPFSVFTKSIQKSQQDDRDYSIIKLENGLQATLVHDPKADKAAASLDVAVGHLYDPDDMPGLAHFCEHLLFMGTEQFPRENEYSEYLAKNNGASNAYTSTSNTNYYFSVSTGALVGALERFSGFFHSPLFAPSCTSRELNAVDSEHKKNHQNDLWRIFQLNKHLSRDGHAWSKFGSGNRESLSKAAKQLKAAGKLESAESTMMSRNTSLAPSPIPSRISSPAPSIASNTSESEADGGAIGRETRRRLVEWWTKEYCASRMRLCVVGQESLEELAELTSKLFSPIPNRGRDALPMITQHPFGPKEVGTLVSVQTIMSFHAMEISFPLEYQPPFWRHKPVQFISHFLGHEGPGSLHSYLKHQSWITALSSGPQNLARGFAMFKVTVSLTENGFRHYREVIQATLKYLSLLRSSKFQRFYQTELATISSTRFRFAEKRHPEEYATWVAEHMAWPVPKEYLLSGPQLTWDWEDHSEEGGCEDKVREYLESFRLSGGRVVLMAKPEEHAKLFPDAQWDKEPWYGTDYRVEKFDDDFIKKCEGQNDIPELFLPGPNEFIPTNLDVEKREVAEILKRPHLIRETPLSTLWHKRDDRFWVPKAHVIIDLRSPVGNASPRASVLTRLYSDVVNDSLTEFSYDADLAGLSYHFKPHTTGLFVAMNGYNDKMPVLVQHVLEKVKGLIVDPERLAVMKEQVKRDWENFFLGHSYALSDYYGKYLLTDQQWTLEEKLKELPSITAEDIQKHMKELLSQVNLRILVTGNIYKDEAMKIAEMAEQGLGLSSLSSIELNQRALVLPEGSNYIWSSPIPNPNQANSALTYYLRYGSVVDQRLRVTSALLTQILSEPAFNVLRTKEQLGYIVSCTPWLLPGGIEKGLRIVVQSEKPPTYLEQRVEAFLRAMQSTLEEMPEAEFAEQKAGLEKKWLEADKNLADEASRFMVHVNSGHHDFLREENDARLLKEITKTDVQTLFLSNLHPSSTTRSKLAVHMLSQKPRPKTVSSDAAQSFENLVRGAGVEVDEAAWKESLGDGEPTLADYTKYWKELLGTKEAGQQLLDAIPQLVCKHPVEGEDEVSSGLGTTYIEDMKSFKASLKVSLDPGPMVQWGDLPISKM